MQFDHIAVPVSDPRAAQRFYEAAFDISLASAMSGEDWEGLPWLLMFFPLPGGGFLALSCFKGVTPKRQAKLPSDARHIALGVAALKPWRARLKKHGIAFREEDHGSQQSLFLEDPDGNVWEIAAPQGAGLDHAIDPAAASATVEAFVAAHGKSAR